MCDPLSAFNTLTQFHALTNGRKWIEDLIKEVNSQQRSCKKTRDDINKIYNNVGEKKDLLVSCDKMIEERKLWRNELERLDMKLQASEQEVGVFYDNIDYHRKCILLLEADICANIKFRVSLCQQLAVINAAIANWQSFESSYNILLQESLFNELKKLENSKTSDMIDIDLRCTDENIKDLQLKISEERKLSEESKTFFDNLPDLSDIICMNEVDVSDLKMDIQRKVSLADIKEVIGSFYTTFLESSIYRDKMYALIGGLIFLFGDKLDMKYVFKPGTKFSKKTLFKLFYDIIDPEEYYRLDIKKSHLHVTYFMKHCRISEELATLILCAYDMIDLYLECDHVLPVTKKGGLLFNVCERRKVSHGELSLLIKTIRTDCLLNFNSK